MSAQSGFDVLIKVKDNTTMVAVGGQKNATLNRDGETIEVTNKLSVEKWKEFISGLKEWGMELDGVAIVDNTGFKALETAYNNGTPIEVSLGKSDDTWGYKGSALITSFPVEAPFDDALTYSISLQGTGKLSPLPTV